MVRRFATLEELSRAAAEEVCAVSRTAVQDRGRFVWALAGGSTPRRLYELVAELPRHDRIDWQRVEVFFGDERGVPPDHPESNLRLAKESLLDRVGLPPSCVHRIRGEEPDLQAEARRYQEEMAQVFGISSTQAPPALDLIVLGMGSDGHTASLFPGWPALDEEHRWFVASESPTTPSRRVTATLPLLNAARNVFFLVAGADKAVALHQVLGGPRDPRRLPAQLVVPVGRLVWFVDQAAAAALDATAEQGAAT